MRRVAKLIWRATCGVDGSRWTAQMKDDANPPAAGSFCPDCQARGMKAPGVLNWVADPPRQRLPLVTLPPWAECAAKVEAGEASALEQFIYHNEPAGRIDEEFRALLARVLSEAIAGGVTCQ